jgi:predicted alpha-1,2-mannosidase
VDGRYTALDKSIRSVSWSAGGAPGAWLSDLSLWDVYRSQTPLLALLAPAAASNLFFSSLADFNATGRPPHWVFANCETGCMPGSHGLGVLADFLVKGIPGPPATDVLAAAIAGLTPQDGGEYSTLGFVPLESSKDCTSLTLDFAFDDACGAVIAELAGPAGAPYAAAWRNRSKSYRNVWDAQAGAMCPRYKNGTFPTCPPLDLPPILLNEYYTEGDGLQYTWSVPHDTAGLLELFPSAANYTALLSTLMVNTPLWPTNALPNPWYWAGNEPGVLAPWQFSLVPGEEWRTQYWVRWILDTYYQLTADGVPGNSDFGELESWAVWACLGLYPMTATPGGTYILGSPCFKDVSLGPPSAPLLRVLAHNFSAASVYVVNATLNGKPLPSPFVNHSALLAGSPSLLEFFLTDTPVRWGGGAPAGWD